MVPLFSVVLDFDLERLPSFLYFFSLSLTADPIRTECVQLVAEGG